MGRKEISQEIKKKIEVRLREGVKINKIAAECHVSTQTVHRMSEKLGIVRENKTPKQGIEQSQIDDWDYYTELILGYIKNRGKKYEK